MSEICLVHLVWKPLGLQPLHDFVASYRRNSAGVAHRLVIAFNGFDSETDVREYRDVLAGVEHEWFLVTPPTQDLPVYFRAAQSFGERYFCFVNSYSVILDEGWLAKMHLHLATSGVGLVGASGSYESYYTNLELERWRYSTSRFLFRRLVHDLPLLYKNRRTYTHFEPFPNYHIRTNAFMLAREVMLGLRVRRLRTKMDCFKLESGREGITRQIMRMGLKPLVVGRDGRAYEKGEWFESATFRSGGQNNLLVSDNQTRQYAEADPHFKSILERVTWGSLSLRNSLVNPETYE